MSTDAATSATHAADERVARQLVDAHHVAVDDQPQDLRVGEDQELVDRRQRECARERAPVAERMAERGASSPAGLSHRAVPVILKPRRRRRTPCIDALRR